MKIVNSTIQLALLVPFYDAAVTKARALRLRIPMPFLPRIGETIRFTSSVCFGIARFQVRSVEHVPYALDGKTQPASADVEAVLVSTPPAGMHPLTAGGADEVLSDVLRMWCWDDQPIAVLREDGGIDVEPNVSNSITTVVLSK